MTENEQYTVFVCRKCEHNLFVKDSVNLGKKLGKICKMDCPNCGEQGEDNWILSYRSEKGAYYDGD